MTLMTLVFKYIFVTLPYTMPFLRRVRLLPIIERLGRSLYCNAISAVLLYITRAIIYIPRFVAYDNTLALKVAAPVLHRFCKRVR